MGGLAFLRALSSWSSSARSSQAAGLGSSNRAARDRPGRRLAPLRHGAMIAYVLQRLLAILAILAVMSVLIFLVTQVLPGNVAYVIAGQFATPDVVAAIEQKLGLNDPAYV